MIQRTLIATTVTALLSSALAWPAQAFDQSDVVTGDLRPGWQTKSGSHMAALQVQLAPSW